MCVSSARAEFRGTTVYAGEVHHDDGAVIHVVGYQNKVRNLADGPNAMLLHIPAKHGMSQQNLIPTKGCSHVLSDMARATLQPTGEISLSAYRGMPKGVEIFKSGIYTVVLAHHAQDIPEVLHMVEDEKRPPLNQELFDWYGSIWPDWSVALCCFNNRDSAKATPMMWWYDPLYPDILFAPGADCHTGGIPDLKSLVLRDHCIIFGSDLMGPNSGEHVHYTDSIPREVSRYLPARIVGGARRGFDPNGDFTVPVASVRDGRYDMEIKIL